jgi:alcohol dehydrogenase (cytochrome c)
LHVSVESESDLEETKSQIGQPVTLERNGQQYVTVTSGIGGVYARQPDPNLAHVPRGGSLWTFKLPAQ